MPKTYNLRLEKKFYSYLDCASATLVLISLYYINENPVFWITYALACFVYVVLNWKKDLYGQSIMNIVAGLIAIKNFIGI